jgi:hypothetical protein
MSQENVETVRRTVDKVNAGEIDQHLDALFASRLDSGTNSVNSTIETISAHIWGAGGRRSQDFMWISSKSQTSATPCFSR